MSVRYFEDWKVGDRLESGTVDVSEASILAFAREYDPQDFHLDPEAAQHTFFGRLSASGWQTAGYAMRLLVESGALGAGGIGVGVDGLRWLRPVYPGDSLRISLECTHLRPSTRKPSGLVQFKIATYNQHGEEVMKHTAMALVPCRSASSAQ